MRYYQIWLIILIWFYFYFFALLAGNQDILRHFRRIYNLRNFCHASSAWTVRQCINSFNMIIVTHIWFDSLYLQGFNLDITADILNNLLGRWYANHCTRRVAIRWWFWGFLCWAMVFQFNNFLICIKMLDHTSVKLNAYLLLNAGELLLIKLLKWFSV